MKLCTAINEIMGEGFADKVNPYYAASLAITRIRLDAIKSDTAHELIAYLVAKGYPNDLESMEQELMADGAINGILN